MVDPVDPLPRLCDDLEALRELAAQDDLAERLQELVDRARAGEDVRESLREVLHAMGVPAVGPPRTDVFAPSGYRAVWPGERLPTAEVYICPLALCGHVWVRVPGAPVPRCALTLGPLSFEER